MRADLAATRIGQVGPRGAGWRGYEDRPSGAASGRVREWTWGGVRLGPGYKDRPSGTA